MFNLPIYTDIIIRQGRAWNMPVVLHEEEYDTITGVTTDAGPWDTSGMPAKFSIRPIIAAGELGTPFMVATTANGKIEVGIQGLPGLEVSIWVWFNETDTDILPWGIGQFELAINPGSGYITVVEGKAQLQRKGVI